MIKGIIIFDFDYDTILHDLFFDEDSIYAARLSEENTYCLIDKIDMFCKLYPCGTLDDLELLVDTIYEADGHRKSEKHDPAYVNMFNHFYYNLDSEFVYNNEDPRILRAIEEDIKNGRIKG